MRGVRTLAVAAAAIAAACAWTTTATAAPATPLTAEALWKLSRVGDPSLAPDGRTAVFSVTTFDVTTDKPSADLWLADVTAAGPSAPKRLTTDPASESEATFSPDGKTIAFVAKRAGDSAAQIYLLPVSGGEARRLTDVPTGASRIQWMPDGSGVAFVTAIWADLADWDAQAKRLKEREGSKMSAKVWTKSPISAWDSYLDDRVWHVYVAPVDGSAVRAVTRTSGIAPHVRAQGGDPFDISPDGKEFAVVSNSDKTGVSSNLDVYLVPAAGGSARNVTQANLADDSDPLFAPDGKRLAFLQQRIRGFYADTSRLMILDRASGRVTGLTETFDRSVGGLAWRSDGQALYGAFADGETRRVFRFDVRGGAPTPLTKASDFGGLETTGSTLIGLRQSFDAPSELVRIDTRSGAVTQLTALNAPVLGATARGKVESVTYKGANGADIQMWVIYPPGFDPAKKYPLMLLLHGGPHSGITDAWTYRWNAHVFAGWGYVVAWHNFHGSSGFGQAFTDSITANWMDKPYEDTIKAADWFAAKPWIDKDRMVAAGASYGGYLANVLLGKPHPFKALVSHAGVFNHYTQLASDAWVNESRYPEYWEQGARAEFERTSPHLYVANFKTPTLVIHGQTDLRVPVNNSIEMFQTLQKLGVPSKLVYFPDENHWISKPQNSIFWYGQVRDWVTTYAPPGPRDAGASGVAAAGK